MNNERKWDSLRDQEVLYGGDTDYGGSAINMLTQ